MLERQASLYDKKSVMPFIVSLAPLSYYSKDLQYLL